MNAPIFIVGTPRSGTTLTACILGRHSRIFMPGETHFFDDIYARRRALGELNDGAGKERVIHELATLYGRYNEPEDQKRVDRLFTEDHFAACFKDASTYLDLFSRFMAVQMKQEGKARWGNQVPRDLFNIDELLSFYPDCKIVICVRDVRDFLVSYRDKWKATATQEVARLKNLYHPVVTALLWKTSMRRIDYLERRVAESNRMIVRYENLVMEPEEVVKKICCMIGEKFEPEMLLVESHNSSADNVGKGVFSSSVGHWKKFLAAEDAFLGQWIGKSQLKRFDYALETIPVDPVKVVATFFNTPFAFIRALIANRQKRGPLLPYLEKRFVALFARQPRQR